MPRAGAQSSGQTFLFSASDVQSNTAVRFDDAVNVSSETLKTAT